MQTVALLEIISTGSEKIIEICGVQWLIPKFSLYFSFIILVMQILKRKDVKYKYSGLSSLEAGLMNIGKIKLEVVLEFKTTKDTKILKY